MKQHNKKLRHKINEKATEIWISSCEPIRILASQHYNCQAQPLMKIFFNLLKRTLFKFSFLTKTPAWEQQQVSGVCRNIFEHLQQQRPPLIPKPIRDVKRINVNSILTPVTSLGALFLGHVYVMARLRLSSRMLKRLSLWATLATYKGVLRQNRPTYGISHVVIDLINYVMKNSYLVRD